MHQWWECSDLGSGHAFRDCSFVDQSLHHAAVGVEPARKQRYVQALRDEHEAWPIGELVKAYKRAHVELDRGPADPLTNSEFLASLRASSFVAQLGGLLLRLAPHIVSYQPALPSSAPSVAASAPAPTPKERRPPAVSQVEVTGDNKKSKPSASDEEYSLLADAILGVLEGSADGKKYEKISMSDLLKVAKTWDSMVTSGFTLGEVFTECEKLQKRNKLMVQDGVVYSI